jgi:hypothetical protein
MGFDESFHGVQHLSNRAHAVNVREILNWRDGTIHMRRKQNERPTDSRSSARYSPGKMGYVVR